MRIRIKREKRKSIAYSLAPEELTIILPNDGMGQEEFDSLMDIMSNANAGSNPVQLLSRAEVRGLVTRWAGKLQARPNRVQIRSMRNKWASCSREKNVVFNSILITMPREFVEYVICHELLHLKVPRHNKLFGSLLSAYMPDWKERVSRTVSSVCSANSDGMASEIFGGTRLELEGR